MSSHNPIDDSIKICMKSLQFQSLDTFTPDPVLQIYYRSMLYITQLTYTGTKTIIDDRYTISNDSDEMMDRTIKHLSDKAKMYENDTSNLNRVKLAPYAKSIALGKSYKS